MPSSLTSELEPLRSGVHILTTVLLLVVILTSINMPMDSAISNLLLMSSYAAIYFGGWNYLDRWQTFPKLVWLVALTMLWLMDAMFVPAAMYLVFSLLFLYLRVFDGWWGIIWIIFATAATIGIQLPKGLTFGGVMGPAVSALVAVAIHFTYMKMVKTNVQLKETQAELAVSRHNAGVIAERQRIAHEIHDTLAQGLSSIQMLLHAADRDLDGEDVVRARTRIDLARKTAADNLQEARAMIAALQPTALATTSLAGALERMAEGFAASAEMNIEVDVEGEARQIPMKQEAMLLRVAQGAVGNVAKHAQATRARVTITYEEKEVRVDVVDNGTGFNVAAVKARPAGLGHIGLTAMRRRAEELGGEVSIESTPGSGTAVSVSVPVD